MKRKVNLAGPSTLTVSLPQKWTKKYNVKKGDEIEVSETGNTLMIGKGYENIPEKTSLDVTGQNTMVHRIIAASYKAGYDQVDITYSTPKELEIIQDRLDRNLSGFDVIEYEKNLVKVKSIANFENEHFETVLKRAFFSMNDLAVDSVTAIKAGEFKELKNLAMRDKNVDKYTDYCRRFLNKGVQIKYKREKPLYYLIEQIEIIGDMYKDLLNEIADNKITLSPELLRFFKDVNAFLKIFTSLMLDFKYSKVNEFGEKREELSKRADKLFDKVSKKELKIFFLILQAFNAIFEMKGAMLTLFL